VPAIDRSCWKAVDSFATDGQLDALAVAFANVGLAERFESNVGGRALLLPLRPLVEGEVPGLAVTDAPTEATEVLFLDPADGATALSLLAALGNRGRSVRVALPGQADPTGLIPEVGHVTIATGSGPPVPYEMFRAADRGKLDPKRPAAPKLGEGEDVLEQRSKWFQTRESRAE